MYKTYRLGSLFIDPHYKYMSFKGINFSPFRLTVNHYPILMYCVECGKTIFYPLSRKMFGSNICLLCWLREFNLKEQIRKLWGMMLWGMMLCKFSKHKWDILPKSTGYYDGRISKFLRCSRCEKEKEVFYSPKYCAKVHELSEEIAQELIEESERLQTEEHFTESEAAKYLVYGNKEGVT